MRLDFSFYCELWSYFFDGELASLILHGYSPFFTSAGVIALGCFLSPARRVYDST